MRALLLKYLTPLSWLLWAMIAIGIIDHFFLVPRGRTLLPPGAFDWLLLAMWPLLLAVWFGWKEKEKQKAMNPSQNDPDA